MRVLLLIVSVLLILISLLQGGKSDALSAFTGNSDLGLFQNVKRTVTSLISKEEFYAIQSEKFVEDTFEGSLPAFLVAFGKRKKYTDEEVEKMKQILDSMRG